MKINPTLLLTSLFLLLMMATGSVSAIFGYNLGYKALKGVSQPDLNPTRKLRNNTDKATPNEKGLILVDEKKLLIKNYDYVKGYKKKKKTETNPKKTEPKSPQKTGEKTESKSENKTEKNLSLKSINNSVVLEAVKVKQEEDSLLINLNLINNGNKAVRFVYSFLEVQDNKNNYVSAIVDGLPGELPANGNKYSGTVRIPISLLEESEKLTLSLTDYPNQNIKLKITNIPLLK
jgi:hypothetical protein